MTHPKEALSTALKDAMKSGDKLRRDVIRQLNSALKQVEIDKRIELTPADAIDILTKEAKRYRESIEEFTKGGRPDLVAEKQAELAILEEFLPTQLTPDEIRALVQAAIAQTGATSAKEMGKVMGILQPQVRGRAEGKLVSDIVREMLG